tara:strand:+ start:273 stop:6269 length:5997 start_codon:yes stop_codon:yes gene_type:complete
MAGAHPAPLAFYNAELSVTNPTPETLPQNPPRPGLDCNLRKPTAAQALGSIVVRTGWKPKAGISGLAIIAPSDASTQSDCLRLLTDDSIPPVGADDVPSMKLAAANKRMSAMQGKYELLRPNLLHPPMEGRYALGDQSLVIAGGQGQPRQCIVKIRNVDFTNQTVDWAPVLQDGTLGQTAQVLMSTFLRSILVGETGAREWDGITMRMMTTPPEGVAFILPPPPPLNAIPPPPPPEVKLVDISERRDDICDASMLRTILSGAPGFPADLDWSQADFMKIMHWAQYLTTRLPLSPQEAARCSAEERQGWMARLTALISLKYTDGVIKLAARVSTDPRERLQLLIKHDNAPTPQKSPPPRDPVARHDNPPPRPDPQRPISNLNEGGAGLSARFRAAGGNLMGEADDPAFMEIEAGEIADKKGSGKHTHKHKGDEQSSDDSSDTSEDEGDRNFKHKKHKSDKDTYPSLAQICPKNMSLKELATTLGQRGETTASATMAIDEALKLARIPLRQTFGSDEYAIGEASVAVALEAMASAGIDPPKKPATKAELIGITLHYILRSLHAMAMRTNQGQGDGGFTLGAGHHRGAPPSSIHNSKPADDFDRSISHSAAVATSVCTALREPCPQRDLWTRKAQASGGEITPGAPPDVMRLMMADKYARYDAIANLAPMLGDTIVSEVAAREAAAKMAAERCLRGELAPGLSKQFLSTVVSLTFDKMPSLAKIAEATATTDALGHTRTLSESSPIQAAAATRAAMMAAWPELNWTALMAAEDDIRGLILGKQEGGSGPIAATARAAQLWTDVGKHIQKRANLFRQRKIFAGEKITANVNDIFETKLLMDILDEKHESNTAAMTMLSTMQLSNAFTSGPAHQGGGARGSANTTRTQLTGKTQLAELTSKWKDEFGGDACMYFHLNGLCKKGANCPRKHDADSVDAVKLATWVKRNNADCPINKVSPQPESPPGRHADPRAHAGMQAARVPPPAHHPDSGGMEGDVQGQEAGNHEQPQPAEQGQAEGAPPPQREEESAPPPPPMTPVTSDGGAASCTVADRHARAVGKLRQLPEGAAMARLEATPTGPLGMYDPLRRQRAPQDEARLQPTRSVLDRAISAPAQPHRVQRWRDEVMAAGGDVDWRPSGDATTLFLEGKQHAISQCNDWGMKAAQRIVLLHNGETPPPLQELRQDIDEYMLPEAAALAPWAVFGEYYYAPIPWAILYQERVPRVVAMGHERHEVRPEYYRERMEAGDSDQDICFQYYSYGLDVGSKQRSTLLVFHLEAMWADEEIRDKSLKAIDDEVAIGAFRKFEGIAVYPIRHPPRFAVDEGLRQDGSRKIRAIVHHSYPKPVRGIHRYPEGSTNSEINLEDMPALRMGSGRAFWASVDPLTQVVPLAPDEDAEPAGGMPPLPDGTHPPQVTDKPIAKGSIEDQPMSPRNPQVWSSKRDGKNAFRQADIAPLDWWMSACFWPDMGHYRKTGEVQFNTLLDGAIGMGMGSAMLAFGRAMDVPARHVATEAAMLDAEHPPTEPEIIDFLKTRIAALGPTVGARLDTDEHYVDDNLRAGINREIVLTTEAARWSGVNLRAGQTYGSEEVKLLILDRVWERELQMTMAGGDKRMTVRGGWMEALGVEGSANRRMMRYPERKRVPLIQEISQVLSKQHKVEQTSVQTLIQKEKWLTHLALELDHRLASGYAVARAHTRSSTVTLSAACVQDQTEIMHALEEGTEMPLAPRSTFPAFADPRHAIVFQDASSTWGGGGWALIRGELHATRIAWPDWVLHFLRAAAHGGDTRAWGTGPQNPSWSISPGELWMEWIMLMIVARTLQCYECAEAGEEFVGGQWGDMADTMCMSSGTMYVSDFTDNDAALSVANKGTSQSPAMQLVADHMKGWPEENDAILRTARVTTKENFTSDAMSRPDGEHAAHKLAETLGVPLVTHALDDADDKIWLPVLRHVFGKSWHRGLTQFHVVTKAGQRERAREIARERENARRQRAQQLNTPPPPAPELRPCV